jgi:fumarylacetoacetase
MKSWIKYSKDHSFPLENIPFGVFQYKNNNSHCATRIGDYVIDLFVLNESNLFPEWGECFSQSTLNMFMSLGKETWKECRIILQKLFDKNGKLETDWELQQRCMRRQNEVQMLLPANIGDYTDFYSSIWHASNLGFLYR